MTLQLWLTSARSAINIEHKSTGSPLLACITDRRSIAERTNAFVTLVFGYSVVALLFQNRASYGINAYVLRPLPRRFDNA